MRFEFPIAEGLPADDVVAQFVTVAAMISNDWQRLVTIMDEAKGSDQVGLELLSYRLQAALHYEATHCLREAQEVPEVADFVEQLPMPAHIGFGIVLSGLDRDPEVGHGAWFGENPKPHVPFTSWSKTADRESA